MTLKKTQVLKTSKVQNLGFFNFWLKFYTDHI